MMKTLLTFFTAILFAFTTYGQQDYVILENVYADPDVIPSGGTTKICATWRAQEPNPPVFSITFNIASQTGGTPADLTTIEVTEGTLTINDFDISQPSSEKSVSLKYNGNGGVVTVGDWCTICMDQTHDGAADELWIRTSLVPGSSDITTKIPIDQPLALSLTNFVVDADGYDAHIQWATPLDANQSKSNYEIQRSVDGASYKTVGNLSSPIARTSQGEKFSFTDRSVGLSHSSVYYRLKKTDASGETDISEVKTVTFNQQEEISIFPTKTSDVIHIGSVVDLSKNSYAIFDSMGRQVMSKDMTERTIDVSHLTSGVYAFVLYSGSSSKPVSKKKFIKN